MIDIRSSFCSHLWKTTQLAFCLYSDPLEPQHRELTQNPFQNYEGVLDQFNFINGHGHPC